MSRASEVLPRPEEIWNLNDEAPRRPVKTADKAADKTAPRASDKPAKAEPEQAGERGEDDKSPSIAPKT